MSTGVVTDSEAPAGLTWELGHRSPAELRTTADPCHADPEWLYGGSDGSGVRVCVLDSGIEGDHPLVGDVDASWVVERADDGLQVVPCAAVDVCGHGTACAGVIRRVAPGCELHSVRVLGEKASGSGAHLLVGLRWAVEQGFDVINLSLSTRQYRYADELRTIADRAFFSRTVVVASAHNTPVESYPWRFASVISVGSHAERDQDLYLFNPSPPVEFFAPGQDVELAWRGGLTIRATGNSFATPFVAGMCARILAKHPRMTPFQLKTALYLGARNVRTSQTTGDLS